MPNDSTELSYHLEVTRCECHPGMCRCPRYSIFQGSKIVAQGNDLSALETLLRATHSEVSSGYTVEEKGDDGLWRRAAVAHIWEKRKDARAQRAELAKRFPRKRFAVTPVYSSNLTQAASEAPPEDAPGSKKASKPQLVLFDSLPYGARFRYPEGKDVWVKLSGNSCGSIAGWGCLDPYWLGQPVCSFEDSPELRAQGKVVWLDVAPSVEQTKGQD